MSLRLVCLTGALLSCTALESAPALAQSAASTRPYDLPAESLNRALARFTRASGVLVAVDASLTRGRRSSAVRGSMTARDALNGLLRGTGLRASADGAGGFVVAATPAEAERPRRLPQAETPRPTRANPPIDERDDAEEITVTGRLEREASIGKADASIKETPATINVVDRELLDLRLPRSFVEALRGVPGITQRSARITAQNNLSRGFALRTGGELRNGLRHFDASNLAPETTNVERFEVLKGPASILYGTGGLGGLFNVVTKRPDHQEAFGVVEAGVGSFGFYRGALDLNTLLSSTGALSARLNAHRERSGSQQDFVDQDTVLVAPTLSWKPTARTSLVLDAEYLRGDFTPNLNGVPADGSLFVGPSASISRSRSVRDLAYNSSLREQIYLSLSLDHRFSDKVTLHQGLLYSFSNKNRSVSSDPTGFVGGFSGPRRFLERTASVLDVDWASLALDTNVNARFTTSNIRHELLLGIDYYRSSNSLDNRVAPIAPFDLVSLNYRERPTGPFSLANSTRSVSEFVGFYVQETLIPADQLRLVLAGRFSLVDTLSENRLNQANTRRTKDKPFTPRVGAVWTPIPPLSVFASYSESFLPLTGLDFAGRPFEPETGRSYEVGLKASILGGLDVTFAVFDMKRQNVSTPDPVNSGFNVQTGEQTSRGVELEANGYIQPGWRMQASYAFLDTEVSRDNSLLVGQPIQGVPKHAANLFTDYEFQSGRLQGFSLNAAASYEGRRWGQLVTAANQSTVAFYVPDYLRFDAGLSYRGERFEIALSLKNVFDNTYFSGVLSRLLVYYGDKRNLTFNVRIKF